MMVTCRALDVDIDILVLCYDMRQLRGRKGATATHTDTHVVIDRSVRLRRSL